MPVDLMFVLATLAFAWGFSLATYRWFAVHNGWPMGEWQAHRPGLPIAIGVFAMGFAVIFGLARSGSVTAGSDYTALIVPLFGVLCALAWTAITRIGAQSALILAPIAVMLLLLLWIVAIVRADAERASLNRPLQPLSSPSTASRPLDPAEDRPGFGIDSRGIATDRQPSPVTPPVR